MTNTSPGVAPNKAPGYAHCNELLQPVNPMPDFGPGTTTGENNHGMD